MRTVYPFIQHRAAVAAIVLIFGMLGSTASVFAQVNPGDIIVLDDEQIGGAGGEGKLFSVALASSSRRVISDLNNPGQDPIFNRDELARSSLLRDVAVSASGDIVILDTRSNEAGIASTDVGIVNLLRRIPS
jgi:hypothetical protein